ncbi:AT hook domain-containing protein [Colletotrichum sublineola]|uniref:Putative AT hook domain-containing protein n=1 Tax=Colletotrichum sublineola TaxID=1173701 RepID=A0A066XR51_COLSU|nr:AT hook domain-containing protein [Colletotrichum sublineola]KDN68485.1 putative AT hook domain-containing protein [Colletotrichum sublineola]
MTTRAERMQQRMRGAGHGQVEDVSFQLDFGDDLTATGVETQTSPERPTQRTTPNTSAKRRRLDTDAARPAVPAINDTSPTSQQPSGKEDPSELQEESSTEPARLPATQTDKSPAVVVEQYDTELVESLPPSRPAASAPPVSPVSRRGTGEHTEVEESPLDAPGSGRRRTIATSSALASSARLQQALSPGDNETETVPISSPLERKVRRNTAGTRSSRGSRNSAASADDGPGDTSPDQTVRSPRKTGSPELSYRHDAELEELTAPVSEPASPDLEPEPEMIVEEVHEVERDHEESLAEEMSTNETAQRIGRKRPRRSPKPASPEPDSTIDDEDHDEPLPKRRRKQAQKSPAKQKQGRPKGTSKAKDVSPKAATKRKKKKQGADGAGESVTIPVQRFTKRMQVAEGDEDDADVLNMDIPFAGRSGVNTVDVLTQVCDEVIETSLDTLKEGVRNAQDKSSKREYQVQFRALEAYQEELRNRLLQHTILLDALHSLRKRVRSVQKERIALRDEIMRIRAERDQVALRKDAIRIRHEKVTEEALNQLSLSTQMHDIDLAVERGRAAPELGPAEKKTAELANLEILISRITDQACSKSGAGGTLKQIKDFNALLERAAVALEGR